MGIIQAFFGLGALLGPILGATLFAWSGAWETPFYVFGGVGIVMALIIASAVPRESAMPPSLRLSVGLLVTKQSRFCCHGMCC